MHKRSHIVRGSTCKTLSWMLSFSSLQLASVLLLRLGTLLTLAFHVGRDFLPLSGEHTYKLWLLGAHGYLGFTCILAHLLNNPFANQNTLHNSSQPSSKNVNKEQKLLVPNISEGLLGNRAFLKLILLQAWPRPFLSTPFSKATVHDSAPYSSVCCPLSHIGRHRVSP